MLLIHSRLAIRGLVDEFSQPFKCSDNSILIYNGELYNTKEIEADLGLSSCESDTPVFAEYVISNQFDNSKLDGMFAYVRYCKKSDKVYVGRDMFGEKHLENMEILSSSFPRLVISALFKIFVGCPACR